MQSYFCTMCVTDVDASTVFNTGGRERVQETEESIVYFNNPTHM